jgi:hypothetical protein
MKAAVRGRWLWACVLLVVGIALVLAHGPLLSWGVRAVLASAASAAGLQFEARRVEAALFRPWVIEGLVLQPGAGSRSRTAARAERVEVRWSSPFAMLGRRGRIVDRVWVHTGDLLLDFEGVAAASPMRRESVTQKEENARRVLWLSPRAFALEGISGWIVWPGGRCAVQNLDADFSEAALGELRAAGAEVWLGEKRWVFASQRAVTSWAGGELALTDMDVQRGIGIEKLAVSLGRPGGPGLELRGRLFGGMVRGGGFLEEWRGEPGADVTVWASGVDLAEAIAFLGKEGPTSGRLGEMRATFRGNPARPLEAEASLRLDADGVRRGARGWDQLEVIASLINSRLTLNSLELRQKDNTLSARGEAAVAGRWEDIRSSPFSVSLKAVLNDLGSLGALFGPPLGEIRGRMTATAEVTGRTSNLDGFLSIEASDMRFRGRTFESCQLEALFEAGEMLVERLELSSGRDAASGKGAIGLTVPHQYWGQVNARIADLGEYADLGPQPTEIAAGRVNLRWQGDGNAKAHSGAFDIALDGLLSPATPEGLAGKFSGTYSPGNVYLGGFEMLHGAVSLSLRATLADSGIKAEDLSLGTRKTRLASGEFYLPVDVTKLASGQGLAASAIPGRHIHARLESSGEVSLEDVFGLAGRKASGSGRLRLNLHASGPIETPEVRADLRIRDLLPKAADRGDLPPSLLDLAARASDGAASVNGTLTPRGFPGITLAAAFPFGLSWDSEGRPQLVAPDQPIRAQAVLPPTNLAIFEPLLAGIETLSGRAEGRLEVGGSLSAPEANGGFELRDVTFQLSGRAPVVDQIEARVSLAKDVVRLGPCSGRVAAGPFQLEGTAILSDLANPRYDLSFRGEEILLHRSRQARVRAGMQIRASGDNASGRIEGEVGLVDGRSFQRVEITPFLAPSPADRDRPLVAPDFEGLIPAPFRDWTLDVSVRNATPFQIVGDVAEGTIEPDLRLLGTLGRPLIQGAVAVNNARAFLPFTTMHIGRGRVDFYASDPWMPYLDVRATAQAMDYDVFLYAYGPLSQKNLVLRSDPPLSQEALILLLTTGFAPGYFSGAGFGEAAAGQGGLLVLRQLLRQFELRGVDTESLLDRVQVTNSPPSLPGDRASMRGRMRLWRGLSVMAEQDHSGFYNVGATYRFRFR